jgi:hypothetical protein
LGKLAEKTRRKPSKKGPKVAENGAFSRVKAPFRRAAGRRALDRKPLSCRSLSLRSPTSSCRQRPAKPAIERHFSLSGPGGPVSLVRCPWSVAGIAPALAGRCLLSFVHCPLSVVPGPLLAPRRPRRAIVLGQSLASRRPWQAAVLGPLSLVRCSFRAGPCGPVSLVLCPWSVAGSRRPLRAGVLGPLSLVRCSLLAGPGEPVFLVLCPWSVAGSRRLWRSVALSLLPRLRGWPRLAN